ncbi:MAG: helix-turn-helix domain-containing protein [Marinilabiliales bacterium]|nr:helix-turn-helix domain-containing protein [Marinilabiliales bacterium]
MIDQRKILREKFSKEINIQPDSIVTNSIDKEFINKILLVLEKNLSNEKLDMELLAKEIFLSQRQLHRKIKAITGHTPGEFIRIFKLKRAR